MENFKTEDILKTLVPYWKKLTTVLIFSILVGIFISSEMVIKPLYKSYAIVYPVNLIPSSEESNTEQLLQWFNSEEVKKAVCEKFDLYKHYDIDTLDKRHQTWFNLKYKELVSINSTLYESVEITVKDQSPEMSKKIVQGIIDATNELIMSQKKEILKEYIYNYQNELKLSEISIDSIKTLVNDIKKEFNIIDEKSQAKYISKELASSSRLSESNSKTAEGIKTKGVDLDKMNKMITGQLKTYNFLNKQKALYHLDYANKVRFTNVVSKPTLPDSKCYPIRSLIVAIISLSSLLVACIVIIFLNIKKQQID
jgi:capsule polysaccharide export protein KpsE/RkpR